ncbi:MAG TPA: nickel-responsive transcriptional regulator NikR [Myxococcales bacterium]|jgi:CopG family nickel-responsive transcriptional regulator|nr:nickel-responsive transcriptional regulator NikR [Myxococcales bacterium]
MLERVGISLEGTLLEQFDKLNRLRGYENRSEAVRDLIREKLVEREWESAGQDEERVAVAMLVYDHDSASLAQKLTHVQHEHHRAVVSALHVHLDPHNCLEVLILRGKGSDILAMGDSLVSTKGVKFGRVMLATTGRDLP